MTNFTSYMNKLTTELLATTGYALLKSIVVDNEEANLGSLSFKDSSHILTVVPKEGANGGSRGLVAYLEQPLNRPVSQEGQQVVAVASPSERLDLSGNTFVDSLAIAGALN